MDAKTCPKCNSVTKVVSMRDGSLRWNIHCSCDPSVIDFSSEEEAVQNWNDSQTPDPHEREKMLEAALTIACRRSCFHCAEDVIEARRITARGGLHARYFTEDQVSAAQFLAKAYDDLAADGTPLVRIGRTEREILKVVAGVK